MSLQSDLYSRLSGYAGLTALVGTRIYPVLGSHTVSMPYCVYQVISRNRTYSHQGFSSLERYRLQISCVDDHPDSVRDVVTQVIAAMEGWTSVNSSVQMCLHDDEFDDFNEEAKVYRVPLDFIIDYNG